VTDPDVLRALDASGAIAGLTLPANTEVCQLTGHASTRRFFRARTPGGTSAILVVYPESDAAEGLERFERAARWFMGAGVRVPRIWQRGERALLMADAGDQMLDGAQVGEVPRLYRQAMSIVARLQKHGRHAAPPNPEWALDGKRLAFELDFMDRHALRGWLGVDDGEAPRQAFYDELSARLDRLPRAFCHRDFHSRNLMVHQERLLVVDFQDAMEGPVFYDAASLLLDNYVDVPTEIVTAALASAQKRLGVAHAVDGSLRVPDWPRGLAPGNRQAFALTALQRLLKALGTFGYQVTAGGNTSYARYAGRTWGHARRLLRELGWGHYEELLTAFDQLATGCQGRDLKSVRSYL